VRAASRRCVSAHAGLQPEEVVQASFRLFEFLPRVGECVGQFQARILEPHEALALAEHALVLRYGSLAQAPVSAEALLTPRRPEDMGNDLWTALNKAQEQLIRGGLSDGQRDPHGRLRTVRALRGIDSKVQLNQALWTLAERLAHGETLPRQKACARGLSALKVHAFPEEPMVPDRRCDRTPTRRFFARLCTAFEDCALQTTLFHFVKRANGQGNQCSQGSCAASLPAIAGRPRQHFTVSAVCNCRQRCLSSRTARWHHHSSPANPSPGRSAVGLRAGRGEAPRHLKRSLLLVWSRSWSAKGS